MAVKNKIAELKDKILSYVRENGPLVPTDISKHMDGNLIFASAILSELVSNKLLKMSHSKVGGSRLYYVPGQEDKLVKLHDHLPEKLRKAFELLQNNKVLRDDYCEPWERVALRELKDFAVPLTVSIKEKDEVFWKWYIVTDDEATAVIKSILDKEAGVVAEVPASPPEIVDEVQAAEKVVEEKTKQVAEEVVKGLISGGPKKKTKKKKEETQSVLETPIHSEDEFTGGILEFFRGSGVFVTDQKLLKRNKEINFVIEFPSVIGKSCYYAKAKSKKKISDKDLEDAFDEAKAEHLPLLFISDGELTKKAQKFISENMRGIVFKQL